MVRGNFKKRCVKKGFAFMDENEVPPKPYQFIELNNLNKEAKIP